MEEYPQECRQSRMADISEVPTEYWNLKCPYYCMKNGIFVDENACEKNINSGLCGALKEDSDVAPEDFMDREDD